MRFSNLRVIDQWPSAQWTRLKASKPFEASDRLPRSYDDSRESERAFVTETKLTERLRFDRMKVAVLSAEPADSGSG